MDFCRASIIYVWAYIKFLQENTQLNNLFESYKARMGVYRKIILYAHKTSKNLGVRQYFFLYAHLRIFILIRVLLLIKFWALHDFFCYTPTQIREYLD